MALRYPYRILTTTRPVHPRGGAMTREYPVFDVGVAVPGLSVACDSLIDSGSDDTILPLWVAQRLGINLATAVMGDAHPVGSQTIIYRYATVELRISDGVEACSWAAIVGFVDVPMRWGLLGRTGFLEFFDTTLRGAANETLLEPNAAFVGQHIIF